MKNPSLRWNTYAAVHEVFKGLTEHRQLLQIISSNKRADLATLQGIPFVAANYPFGDLPELLEKLRKDGILLENLLPAEFANHVDDMLPFYSINWKMIRAINKACTIL